MLVNAALEGTSKDRPVEMGVRSHTWQIAMGLQPMMPHVEKYMPQQASTLKSRLTEYQRIAPAESGVWNMYQELA